MPDVVLPVLDERDALPWVLGRMPDGYVPIVVDNGLTDGSRAVAAALGAQVVVEPRRFRAPGRRTRGSRTRRWPGSCAAARACRCATSGRCARRVGRRWSPWTCGIAASAGRS